jgi:hypothetical protein
MFDNIGKKIKILAKVITIIGFVISSVIPTILFIYGIINIDLLIIQTGAEILFWGCLFSWIGSFTLYGFGELIDKTTEIANNTAGTYLHCDKTSSHTGKLLNILNEKENIEQPTNQNKNQNTKQDKENNLPFVEKKDIKQSKTYKTIIHKYFGKGTIISTTKEKMIVDFTESGKGLSKMELDIDFCLENNLIEILD